MEYTREQINAIAALEDRIAVVAPPGSGKTAVLTERIRFLISKDVDPSTIYAITFTNNAAQEMMQRVQDDRVHIGTIHSLANSILLSNGIDTSDVLQKEEYEKLFDMVEEHPELKLPRITHLLIDEFQDTGLQEYHFALETLNYDNLFIVGDSCQNIYSFRGSSFKFFETILRDPEATVYTLSVDFRNPRCILNYAQKFLDGMRGIHLINAVTVTPIVGSVYTDRRANEIVQIVNQHKEYKDWFILCRTNAQVDEVITRLSRYSIPCITFKQSEVSNSEMKNLLTEDAVKVLTMHSAKGLESPYVAVIGAYNHTPVERRLSYVAATRASKELWWLKGDVIERHAKQAQRTYFKNSFGSL